MNNPHSQPDNSVPKTESNFLFADWNLPEGNSSTEGASLFDGKIIARMPDLGSESIAKSITKPKFPSFWGQMCTSALSLFQEDSSETVTVRQRFFRRVIATGVIVLVCGIGILLISQDEDKTTKTAVTDIPASIIAQTIKPPVAAWDASIASFPTPQEPARNPKPVVVDVAIPVAPVESVAAVSPPSPWDRPAVPGTPENPFLPIDNTAVNTVPAVSPNTVTMSPMIPIDPSAMQVSPYEMQLLAQSHSQAPPSTGTYVPPYPSNIPPGMMPMHERLENMSATAPLQNTQWQSSGSSQYLPNNPGQAPVHQYPQGQGREQNPYIVPPGYMVPNNYVPPMGTPIPAGVSTLPVEGGQYAQPPYGGMPMQHAHPFGTPVQRPPGDFYNPPPTASRWM